jgi:hypothetical protein
MGPHGFTAKTLARPCSHLRVGVVVCQRRDARHMPLAMTSNTTT